MQRRSSLMTSVFVISSSFSMTCVGEVGTQGPKGEPGGLEDGDCPSDYSRDQSAMNIVLCKRGADEVVRVGRRNSAFWIDRYEASVWDDELGTGKQFGGMMDDYPQTFPKNGQLTAPAYALSKSGVLPSRFITWFQANEACAASGKRLPTNAEWQRAARGTADLGPKSGLGGTCATQAEKPHQTGEGFKCVSDWGAQDMVGNIAEWIGEWAAGIGQLGPTSGKAPWPADYGKDSTANIDSATLPDGIIGLPSAVVRDAAWTGGDQVGVFTYGVDSSPIRAISEFGFRCVIPR